MFVNDRDRRSARRNIRDQLHSLGNPIMIENPIADTWGFFQINGFCVFKGEFEVEAETIEFMKERFWAPELPFCAHPEGSTRRPNRMNAERRSFVSKHLNGYNNRNEFGDFGESVLEEVEENVIMRAKDFFWAGRMSFETLETVAYSRGNSSSVQDPHRGLGDEFVGNSLITMSVVDIDTTLVIFPSSHVSTSERRSRSTPLRFGFDVGDIIFIHPQLIFCEDSHRGSNLSVWHYVIGYHLQEEWDLLADRGDHSMEQLVEWYLGENRNREIRLGVNAAQQWIDQGADAPAIVIIPGHEAWRLMVEAEEDGEWSD